MEQIRIIATYIYVSGLMRADSLFERLMHDIMNWQELARIIVKFANQAKVIFGNPKRYPREAVIIISAIILTFLLILMLVLLFLSLKKQIAIRRASKSVRRKITREEIIKRSVIAGGIALVFILAITVGAAQPSLCAKCHTVEKSYTEWQKSPHKDIGCLKCHYEPGAVGYISGSIGGAENLLGHFFKENELPRTMVGNKSCLRCHNDIFDRIVIGKREIKVQHKDLITGGIACTNCHPDTAHKAKRIKTFAMNNCIDCHNNKVASARCETCHQQDIGYKPNRTLDDWPKIKVSRLNCTGCHKPVTEQGCIDCHGLVLPHSKEFKRKHAMESEATRGQLCYKCHWERMATKRMCGCHHDDGEIHGSPEKWHYEHRRVAKNNGMGCNCHGISFCKRCHDDPSKVYPGGYAGGSGDSMHGGWHTGMR